MSNVKFRYIDGRAWRWLAQYKSRVVRVETPWAGYASQVQLTAMHRRLAIPYPGCEGLRCMADVGYAFHYFLPDGQNWSVCDIIDDAGDTLEWYVDITRENTVDDAGAPRFDDLYLDIALYPSGERCVLDADELDDALAQGLISLEDHALAWRVMDGVLAAPWLNPGALTSLFSSLQAALEAMPWQEGRNLPE